MRAFQIEQTTRQLRARYPLVVRRERPVCARSNPRGRPKKKLLAGGVRGGGEELFFLMCVASPHLFYGGGVFGFCASAIFLCLIKRAGGQCTKKSYK